MHIISIFFGLMALGAAIHITFAKNFPDRKFFLPISLIAAAGCFYAAHIQLEEAKHAPAVIHISAEPATQPAQLESEVKYPFYK